MKKNLFLLLILALVGQFVFAADNDSTATKKINWESVPGDSVPNDTLGVHPWKAKGLLPKEIAHWSMTLEGGFSLFDGDYHQAKRLIIPKTRVRPSAGLSLQYDFTPVLGIMGQYYYANYGVKTTLSGDDFQLYGHMHTLEAYLTFDMIDAWFKHREHNIFSLYVLAGGGIGFYRADAFEEHMLPIENPRAGDKYDQTGIVSLGVLFECNLSRSWALGIKGMYNIYTTDFIDNEMAGVVNDAMEYATIGVRYKFEALKKNHIRNFADEDALFPPVPMKDTVFMSSKDTVVIFHRDTIVSQGAAAQPDEKQFVVFFDNDSYDLRDDALYTIYEAAQYLASDTSLVADIVGYCDNTATSEYNMKLSNNRARVTKNELVSMWNIDGDRLTTDGRGLIEKPKGSYSPNRRAIIYCHKKEAEEK